MHVMGRGGSRLGHPCLAPFRVGSLVLLPVEGLREWLREGAEREAHRAKDTAEEILSAMEKASND